MGPYDRTLKRLTSLFAEDYVRFALQKEGLAVERLEIEGREARADAYVVLRVLGSICHPLELVQRVLQRREIMLESPVYREILEEGRAVGVKEGRELGQEDRLRVDILEVLAVRFERVPADLEGQVGQVRGQKTLELLHRRAVLVESLDAFAQELNRISS